MMNFKKIMNGINEAFLVSGYSRTAMELLQLSDKQLADLGVSRALLKCGYSAYPWRVEAQDDKPANNISQINVLESEISEKAM